jgi:hypothetical protein
MMGKRIPTVTGQAIGFFLVAAFLVVAAMNWPDPLPADDAARRTDGTLAGKAPKPEDMLPADATPRAGDAQRPETPRADATPQTDQAPQAEGTTAEADNDREDGLPGDPPDTGTTGTAWLG